MSTAFAPSGEIRRENPYGIELAEKNRFFYEPTVLEGVINTQTQFKVREDDVFLCSAMKTGTTWMKTIITSIMSESKTHVSKGKGSSDLIPNLQVSYGPRAMPDSSTVIAQMPSTMLLATHMPYSALPPQIKSMGCPIIYIARNPRDTFVSHWKSLPALRAAATGETASEVPKEVFFDSFCNGVSLFGPFVDHVSEFWNASRDQSNILFLTYEDMKADLLTQMRKIADFLGKSSLTEEDIRYIDSQCSFQFVSALDVNRNGKLHMKNVNMNNHSLFRKGEVVTRRTISLQK